MIIFSVAVPADVPGFVLDLLRGYILYLRGVLGSQGVDAVFSEVNEEGKDDQN